MDGQCFAGKVGSTIITLRPRDRVKGCVKGCEVLTVTYIQWNSHRPRRDFYKRGYIQYFCLLLLTLQQPLE